MTPPARMFVPARSVAHSGEPVPDCLGCNLLEVPERCVEYAEGVRCDECGE